MSGRRARARTRGQAAHEAARRAARRLWHGGWPHLRPGDLLLPPAATGNHRQAGARARVATVPGVDLEAITPDDTSDVWVHFSRHRHVALAFAATAAVQFGHGALYVVEPVGPTEPDPDMPVTSLRAAAARVVAVAEPRVRAVSREEAARMHAAALAKEWGRPAGQVFAEMTAAVAEAQLRMAAAGVSYPEHPHPLG